KARLEILREGIGREGMIDRCAEGVFLRGRNARIVIIVVLSREQHRGVEQRRNQLLVIVAATAPHEEADIAQRSARSSALLGDFGVALPELGDEPHRGIAELVLEAAVQRRELDLFDVRSAKPMRLRHGELWCVGGLAAASLSSWP